MPYRHIPLSNLLVNRANDRHGELENETAAIAWLFYHHEPHMRNLAKDIAEAGRLYETPLVYPEGDGFTVFDGNRRVTCLKLLFDPRRAPTVELREFFEQLRATYPSRDCRHSWEQGFPKTEKADSRLKNGGQP